MTRMIIFQDARLYTPKHRRIAAATVTLVTALMGCSRLAEAPSEAVVPTWTVARPQVVIGSETDPGGTFDRVASVVRLDDGSLVVADGGAGVVRLFDPSGTLVREVGGTGGGPGEFTYLLWMRLFGADSLITWDMGLSRASVYDERLELGRTTNVPIAAGTVLYPFGVFPDGSVAALRGPPSLTVSEDGAWELVDLVRVLTDGGEVRLLYNFHLRRCPYRTSGSCPIPPLGDESYYTLHSNEVVLANTATAEIEFIDADGRIVDRIPLDRAGRELTPQETAELEARHRDDPDGLPVPGFMPPFLDLRADSEGNVWILTDLDGTWTVLDRQGTVLRTVRLDPSFRIEQIDGDLVVGVHEDSLGVEAVHVYRLREE